MEQHATISEKQLLVWNLNLPRVDSINDIMWGLAINGAPNALSRAKNLLRTTGKVLRQRL